MFTKTIGNRLLTAPIGDNPKRVLDIGTGTGIWSIAMGR
jgi:ribosomal protein L11 methylase PrmA